jgi:hypothetical protein
MACAAAATLSAADLISAGALLAVSLKAVASALIFVVIAAASSVDSI